MTLHLTHTTLVPFIVSLGLYMAVIINYRRIDALARSLMGRLFGVTIGTGRLGVWNVEGDLPRLKRMIIEGLQLVLICAGFLLLILVTAGLFILLSSLA